MWSARSEGIDALLSAIARDAAAGLAPQVAHVRFEASDPAIERGETLFHRPHAATEPFSAAHIEIAPARLPAESE